jgi:hypothetical protein
VGDTYRTRTGRRGALLLAALFAATLLAATLAACGGTTTTAEDPLAGYWVGGGKAGMMLVHIVKEGDSYTVYANPDYKAPAPTLKDGALVIDTHAVKLTLTPAGTDKLTFELSGETFKTPETTVLKRVSETQYDDAAVGFGLSSIRGGLAKWKAGGGKKYPPASEVSPTGALGQMMAWPNNLFTGQPMQPGTSKGDYIYKQLDGGKNYSLVAHLSDGSTIGK